MENKKTIKDYINENRQLRSFNRKLSTDIKQLNEENEKLKRELEQANSNVRWLKEELFKVQIESKQRELFEGKK